MYGLVLAFQSPSLESETIWNHHQNSLQWSNMAIENPRTRLTRWNISSKDRRTKFSSAPRFGSSPVQLSLCAPAPLTPWQLFKRMNGSISGETSREPWENSAPTATLFHKISVQQNLGKSPCWLMPSLDFTACRKEKTRGPRARLRLHIFKTLLKLRILWGTTILTELKNICTMVTMKSVP